MKLLAGSILAGSGLLVTALGHMRPARLGYFSGLRPDTESTVYVLDTPIEVIAILFMLGGIGLIGWAIWETVKKKE